MRKVKVSIIVVYYGGFKNLMELFKSIKNNQSKVSHEIILVNNKLDEDIWPKVKKKYPSVHFLNSPGNIGYGRGNNFGAKYAKGDYLLFINPDAVLSPHSIETLCNLLIKNKDVGIVSTTILDNNGKEFEKQGSKILTPIRGVVTLSFLDKMFSNNFISSDYWFKNNKNELDREVEAIPGTAFMIRKKLFKNIGGFDKNFFLYFEEHELCKRVREKGYKILITRKAAVRHDWKPAEGGEKLKKVFEQSRFYFFRKHYGIFAALFVEFFARISKNSVTVFSILILAAFLRFWKLKELMPFIGDFAWYYLQARDVLTANFLPLVGITSSVPVLHQGVLWTYMLAFALWIGKFSPLSGGILSVLLGLTAVWGTYMVTSRLVSKRMGIIASLVAATFNLIVFQDRTPFQTAAIFPATLAFFWFANRGRKEAGVSNTFMAGLVWGLLFQLELAAFIFIPIYVVALWLKDVKISLSKLVAFAGGAFWGIVPFIIYDFKSGTFIQTLGFLVWFVTKIYDRLIFFAIAVLIFLLVWNIITKINKLSFPLIFVFVWTVFGTGAFYVKGNFADAYLPLIYFPIVFLIAIFFNIVIKHMGKIGWILFALVIFFNLVRFRNTIESQSIQNSGLADQLQITGFILREAKNKPFRLVYAAPGAQYESGGAEWEYLLWFDGAKIDKNASKAYAIIQRPYQGLKGFTQVEKFGSILVAVKE